MLDHAAPFLPRFLGPRTQIGLVVRDIEAAATYWSEELGVGPWIVIESSGADRRFVHRGQDITVEMQIAFSYVGETQLEMISQTNSVPSLYTEFLDEGREGVHHLGFWPEDFEGSRAVLTRAGFEEVTSVFLPDGTRNLSYYASPAFIGTLVEVAPMTQFRKTYMNAVESLVNSWDGSRPVRHFTSREEFVASDDVRGA